MPCVRKRLLDCEDELRSFLNIPKEMKTGGTRQTAQDEDEDKLLRKEVTPDDFITANDFEEKIFQRHVVGFGHADTLPTHRHPEQSEGHHP